MTPQNQLSLEGNFLTHPFAELVAEIAHADVTGSLRVSNKERKCIVYFKNGRVVFAVSNARSSRLFEIMLKRNRLTSDDLKKIPNFANDFEFVAFLMSNSFLTKEERDGLFKDQIEAILIDVMSWPAGDWEFSSLARVRDGLEFEVGTVNLLVDYARIIPVDSILKRFRSLGESFVRADVKDATFKMQYSEINVLAKLADQPLTARQLTEHSNLNEAETIRSLYVLWLGGMLERKEWHPAFSDIAISMIRGAKLELKREAKQVTFKNETNEKTKADAEARVVADTPAKPVEEHVTLEQYLERVEKAETYYDVLGVKPTADPVEIKHAYFSSARFFHPDHYHKDGGDLLHRVQDAFTNLTQAHETLKDPASRETYDFKIRKEIADKGKFEAGGTYDQRSRQMQQANDSFERGFGLMIDGDIDSALPFLARAVHFDPKNARYHAYYGKALSTDVKNRHKAESEMQTALRIDPQNPTIRIMLAEFFIQMNLLKRAEGELNRLLAIFPSNREARALLDSIQK